MALYAAIAILAGLGSVPLSWYVLRPARALPPRKDPLVEAIVLSITITPHRWVRSPGRWDEAKTRWATWTSLRCAEDGVCIVYAGNHDFPTTITTPANVLLSPEEASAIEFAWRGAQADKISGAALDVAPTTRLLQ